jgi:hypothetical protein
MTKMASRGLAAGLVFDTIIGLGSPRHDFLGAG